MSASTTERTLEVPSMEKQEHHSSGDPVGIRPFTPTERRQFDDIRWAEEDPDVQQRYRGQFVVPFDKKIVAHGHDLEAVLKEAARKTRVKIEELPVIGIDEPLLDVTFP